MKKYLILLTAVFSAVFLSCFLTGTNSPGALIDRDFQNIHYQDRISRINDSSTVKLAVIYDKDASLESAAYQMMAAYTAIINASGGINGKKVELISGNGGYYLSDYLAEVQELCVKSDVAACIGPFNSSFVIPARAITDFASVPLLSFSTVYSETLPSLDDDNYASVFPPLKKLSDLILSGMKQQNIHTILIISPEQGTYGDLFSTQLERQGRSKGAFQEVYRVSYQSPLRNEDVAGMIRIVLRSHHIDAVFFAGNEADLNSLAEQLNPGNLKVPVFATEMVNTKAIRQHGYPCHLYVPNFRLTQQEKQRLDRISSNFADNNYFISYLSVYLMDCLKEILEKNGYDPVSLPEQIRSKSQEFYSGTAAHEKLELLDIGLMKNAP